MQAVSVKEEHKMELEAGLKKSGTGLNGGYIQIFGVRSSYGMTLGDIIQIYGFSLHGLCRCVFVTARCLILMN